MDEPIDRPQKKYNIQNDDVDMAYQSIEECAFTQKINALFATKDLEYKSISSRNSTRMGVITATVPLATSGTVPIGTVPAGSLVTDVITVIGVTPDIQDGTINIGDAGDTNGYLDTGSVTQTAAAVSGEDPMVRGAYLYVPGAQNPGTPFAVTSYGHPRTKYYAADTVVNAIITKGTNAVGTVIVYLFYMRGVMA